MAKEHRAVSLVVHNPGHCSLIKQGEGFSIRGRDLTNPRGGKLCASAICSVFPRLAAMLRDLGSDTPLPKDFFTCAAPGCDAVFKLEEPNVVDQSGIFATPFLRRRTDRVFMGAEDPKNKPVPFIKRLSLDLRDELFFLGNEKKFADGATIHPQGVPVQQLLILTSGTAGLVVRREGEESLIGSVNTGDFFGEQSLLTGLPCDFEVRAVGECTVLTINQKEFYAMLLKRYTVLQIVSRIVSEKLRAAAASVENQLQRGILGKLSMIPLVDLCQTLHHSRRTGTLVVHFNRDQAFILFLDGQIVSAIAGKKRGEEAFYRVLSWHDGEFCFEPSERFEKSEIQDGLVTLDTMGMMMEGLRRLDEHKNTPTP